MCAARVALVTGGNRGIGLNIVKQLTYKKWRVIMGTRDVAQAYKAINEEFDDSFFPKQNVDVLQLDITDQTSIENAAHHIQKRYNSSINCLVNNAGVAFRSNQFNPQIVSKTLQTNFYSTMNVTNALSPFISDRIMFVSSRSGALQQYSKEKQDQFLSEDLTEESLCSMVAQFEQDAAEFSNGSDMNEQIAMERKGWTLNSYALSKAAISMYSRILAKRLMEEERRRVFVSAYCPGYCRTDMTRNQGDRSAVEGAYGLTTLATMLIDHEDEHEKRKNLNLAENDMVPFDVPNGAFWSAFYVKEGDLSSVEVEAIDWVNPAKTLSWNNLLQHLVIRKGKGVLSIDEQASP